MDLYVYQYREGATLEAYGVTASAQDVRVIVDPYLPSCFFELRCRDDLMGLARITLLDRFRPRSAVWVTQPLLKGAGNTVLLCVTAPRHVLHRISSQLANGTLLNGVTGCAHELNVPTLTKFLTSRGLEHTGWVHVRGLESDDNGGDIMTYKGCKRLFELCVGDVAHRLVG